MARERTLRDGELLDSFADALDLSIVHAAFSCACP